MNTPISFELDKLLLEKDIPMPVNPTISDVVMWLYEKHGIWIYVDFYNKNRWFGVFRNKEGVKTELFDVFNSPTEAYEAAIDYILNNLI